MFTRLEVLFYCGCSLLSFWLVMKEVQLAVSPRYHDATKIIFFLFRGARQVGLTPVTRLLVSAYYYSKRLVEINESGFTEKVNQHLTTHPLTSDAFHLPGWAMLMMRHYHL